jgi:SAM-dependent methyltransferase
MKNIYCKICNTKIEGKVFFASHYPLFVGTISQDKFKKNRTWPLKAGFCKNCGHLQQTSPPSNTPIKEMYESDYSYPSALLTGIGADIIESFLVFLKKSLNKKRKNILEIGCFDGYLLKKLQELGYNVLGCDPSQGAEIGIKAGVSIKREFFKPELFPHVLFDLVIMRNVIEHIQNPAEFLKTVRSVLKPRGLVAIETPNYQFSLSNALWCDFHLEHLSFFTPNSLKYLLEKCGFRVISHKDSQMLYFIGKKIKKLPEKIKGKSDLRLTHSVISFQKRTKKFIKDIRKIIHYLIKNKKKIAIYGAGGHTTGLIVLGNLKRNDIAYVVDSEISKWGKFLVGFSSDLKVSPPKRLKEEPVDYIIPSSNWYQEDIVLSIKKLGVKSGFIRLYPNIKISKF